MTTDQQAPNPEPNAAPPVVAPPINHARRNAWILAVLIVVVAIMLLAPRFVKNRPTLVGADPTGQTAPDFVLKDIDGKTVKLSDFHGKAVVLNFWATWCPPCKTEMPWLVDLQQQYSPEGLTVVGVALDEAGDDEIAKFARDMKLNYPVLIGDDKTSDAYGSVQMLPTTFYIDREGKIVARVIGLTGKREIEDNMKEALKGLSQASNDGKKAGGVQ